MKPATASVATPRRLLPDWPREPGRKAFPDTRGQPWQVGEASTVRFASLTVRRVDEAPTRRADQSRH